MEAITYRSLRVAGTRRRMHGKKRLMEGWEYRGNIRRFLDLERGLVSFGNQRQTASDARVATGRVRAPDGQAETIHDN